MLMELLYENAAARPDDVALVYRDERLTHLERVSHARPVHFDENVVDQIVALIPALQARQERAGR